MHLCHAVVVHVKEKSVNPWRPLCAVVVLFGDEQGRDRDGSGARVCVCVKRTTNTTEIPSEN